MRKLTTIVFSLLFLAATFVPAYAQLPYSPYFGVPVSYAPLASTLKGIIRLNPPSTVNEITISNISDLVAPETFVKNFNTWQWKYEGYYFEGLLPPIKMYWVEIFNNNETSCYVPVFYMASNVVIRLSRNINDLCEKHKNEVLMEYIAGKYIKATLQTYSIFGNPQEYNGHVEIYLVPVIGPDYK